MQQFWFVPIALIVLCTSIPVMGAEATLSREPKWMQSPAGAMVSRARETTGQVSIEVLKQALDNDEDVIVLDVREPNEYAVAHIPESINIPRGLLEFSIWSLIPDKNEKILVYCKTGARAALAAKTLNELGYVHAKAVATGGKAWVLAGYPVQTSISDEEFVLLPAK